MKIMPIGLFNFNPPRIATAQNNNEQRAEEERKRLPMVGSAFALAKYINFGGTIKTAERLDKSDYRIAGYIGEISKARYLHGDKAVIDLSMGNPDLTPPEAAKKALREKVEDVWSHRYNNPKGDGSLMHPVSHWMKSRFGVDVDPRKEVMVVSGSADAIDHIFTAYANYGDKILVPNPGYAFYDDVITRHDLVGVPYDIKPERGYLPDFSKMPKDAKAMIINYPHNPTGVFANKKVYEDAVKFAKENGILIIHDMDNSEISHTGKKPSGIMQVEGAKDVAFEVHTFSKAQSMPGLRVAFAVSSKENIDNLLKAKYLSGGSVYIPVQAAAAAALKDEEGYINKVNKIYRGRKNTTIKKLQELGSDAKPTSGTYYLWVKTPPEFTSDEFFKYVLHKSHVAFTPGTVFGSNGEGYVRMVMTADEDVIERSFDKIKAAGIRFDVPKSELPKELQEEIKQMADGSYTIEPKENRDFKEYMQTLARNRDILLKRFEDKDEKFQQFIPQEDTSKLPWNILKDGYSVYLQNTKESKSVFGDVYDIMPFSDASKYKELGDKIKKQWLNTKNSEAEILSMYKSGTFYPDANYFVLEAGGKVQAVANAELQDDGHFWVRGLNSAPWNQGKDKLLLGPGRSIMARIVSFCLERGHDTLKLATDKPYNVEFYKKMGMKETGTKNFSGVENTVLEFDKEGMMEFLNKFQVNLSF